MVEIGVSAKVTSLENWGLAIQYHDVALDSMARTIDSGIYLRGDRMAGPRTWAGSQRRFRTGGGAFSRGKIHPEAINMWSRPSALP